MLGTSMPVSPATDPAVFADYMRARELHRAGTRDSLEQASQLLERVVAADDGDRYGPGWRLLAQNHAQRAWFGYLPLHQGFAKARAAVQRAIEIDPSDAAAIAVLAGLSQSYDMNLPETARLLKRALSLSGQDETVLGAAGSLTMATGDGPRTIAIFERLARRDPLNDGAWGGLGFAYIVFGRHVDAIAALRKSLELEPDAVFTHEHLGEALLFSGDLDGALAEMQREPHDVMRRLGLAFVYAAQGASARQPSSCSKRSGASIRTSQARWPPATRSSAWTTRRSSGWTAPCRSATGVCSRYVLVHCSSRCGGTLAMCRCCNVSAFRTSRSRHSTSTSSSLCAESHSAGCGSALIARRTAQFALAAAP